MASQPTSASPVKSERLASQYRVRTPVSSGTPARRRVLVCLRSGDGTFVPSIGRDTASGSSRFCYGFARALAGWRQRQREAERGATARGALGADFPSVGLHQVLDDG